MFHTLLLLIVHRPRPFLASQRAQFFFPLPTLFVSSTPLPSFCLPSLSIETTMMRRMRFYYYYSILSLFFFLEQTRSNEAKFKFLVEYPIIKSTNLHPIEVGIVIRLLMYIYIYIHEGGFKLTLFLFAYMSFLSSRQFLLHVRSRR